MTQDEEKQLAYELQREKHRRELERQELEARAEFVPEYLFNGA
jgi:hypothetical protein